jgi:NAD(P)-dependent dehydrogenase (short-subunit alcohol dehydrogenase family)
MPTPSDWVESNIPVQHGRSVLITGATGGLGFETARLLAHRGAHVVLTSRNAQRGTAALRRIVADSPDADLELLALDLTSLDDVRRAAEQFRERRDHLDVLINNAGVMATPLRRTTDGFELQFGTNHLGHYALTGLLLPSLLAGERPRVVTVSSTLHRRGRIRFEDPNWHDDYDPWAAYSQSKLANLLFTFELQRRAAHAGVPLIALAAHPGYAATGLQTRGPQMRGSVLSARIAGILNAILAQDATHGALPTIAAAALPEARGGDYWGPGGFQEMRGIPAHVTPRSNATDVAAAQRLWTLSEELTGITFDALADG